MAAKADRGEVIETASSRMLTVIMVSSYPTEAEWQGVAELGCGMLKVSCDDGFQVVSKDKNELVHLTQWHVEHQHGKKLGESDVLKMAKHP